MMKKLPLIALLALAFNIQANTPVWVKDSSSFIRDGEITLKRGNGSDFNINLNQKNTNRNSQGRTASIMIVGSEGGGYSWAHGFQMADGTYHAYEKELGIYVPFNAATFEGAFEFEEDVIHTITTISESLTSSGTLDGYMSVTCGNENYTGSCSSSCSIETGETDSGSESCSATHNFTSAYGSGSMSAEVSIFNRTTDRFYYSYSMDSDAYAWFPIPDNFKSLLGDRVFGSSSRNPSTGTACSDPDATGNTCGAWKYSSIDVSIYYFFTDDWHGSGVKVGGFDWYTTRSSTGMYVVGDKAAALPFSYLNGLRLTESTSQMFALSGGNLYGFAPGETPEVVMAGANQYPVKAITITGVKNTNK